MNKRQEAPAPESGESENARLIRHTRELYALPDVETGSPEELERRVEAYFSRCAENGIRPSGAGLALALGMSREQLVELAGAGAPVPLPEPCRKILSRACDMLCAQLEDYLLNKEIPTSTGIYLIKSSSYSPESKAPAYCPDDEEIIAEIAKKWVDLAGEE